MDKRFAIFDMDGTLVDSMGYWARLGREYLEGRGVHEGLEPVLTQIESMTMLEAAELFLRSFGLSGTPEEAVAEMNATMEAHYRRDIPLKSGTAEYLRALKARGVTLCVASATAEPLVEACLTRLGVADCFDFWLSCETVGVGKHRSDVYDAAAARMGAQPSETAVYEDALYAARTAKAAGYYLVAVYDPSADAHWDELCSLADESIVHW